MKILNVGCGNDTYGTDFIDIYPTRKEVIKCDVDRQALPFNAESFDEVYAKCIIEHTKNPNDFLKKCYKVLKKGGKIKIITDNAGCWVWHAPLNFLYSQQHYKNSIREGKLDRHYSLYTNLHLANHLSSAGFRNIKVGYMWFENRTTTLKNHLLFCLLTSFARFISFVLPKNISYPHLVGEAVK
jgi:predicted SAM-dependent methyltransferase